MSGYRRPPSRAWLKKYPQRSSPRNRPTYRPPAPRRGYTTVARTRGWAASGEMKYFDCARLESMITGPTTSWPAACRMDPLTTINLGAAAVATPACLFAPTVGSALNQRIGRKCHVKKVKIRGSFTIPQQAAQSAADGATKIRFILLVDTQTNAAQYTAADVINGGSDATSTLSAYQNPNGFGRFRILKDKTYSFSNLQLCGSPTAGDVIQAGATRPFKINHTFKKPLQVNFNATNGGTVADIVDNSLHILCGVDDTTYDTTLAYYTRVAYCE